MEGPEGFDLAPEATRRTLAAVPCCECGLPIAPNPSCLCVNCIRKTVDITAEIPKKATLLLCKGCERYSSPPAGWVKCHRESRELLALCLKRLKGLNKLELKDAGFIWTEPHSRRIKVKITVQKEVHSGTVLQQRLVIEFTEQGHFCPQCHKREAKDTWMAVVQLRQKVRHKKTFHFVEQLMIKHHAHKQTTKIASRADGIDFFFSSKSHAKRMVEFLGGVVPIRTKVSERLVSQNIHEHVSNKKHTFSVEILPICKNDIMCIPKSMAKTLGGISPLLMCDRLGTSLHVIDPVTLKEAEISTSLYWRYPFRSLCDQTTTLTEYCVLDCELVYGSSGPIRSGKYLLADVTIARLRDLGVNDEQVMVRTHLGNILQAGDNVWGFDLQSANINDEHANLLNLDDLPDVILVRKSFSDKRKKRRRRRWTLKTLVKQEEPISIREEESQMRDYNSFLEDIEEDQDLRSMVNLYRDVAAPSATPSECADETFIALDELLDDEQSVAGGESDVALTDDEGDGDLPTVAAIPDESSSAVAEDIDQVALQDPGAPDDGDSK